MNNCGCFSVFSCQPLEPTLEFTKAHGTTGVRWSHQISTKKISVYIHCLSHKYFNVYCELCLCDGFTGCHCNCVTWHKIILSDVIAMLDDSNKVVLKSKFCRYFENIWLSQNTIIMVHFPHRLRNIYWKNKSSSLFKHKNNYYENNENYPPSLSKSLNAEFISDSQIVPLLSASILLNIFAMTSLSAMFDVRRFYK
jgi:hypothetical protein